MNTFNLSVGVTMTCRKEILKCVHELIDKTGSQDFTIQDIIDCMEYKGSRYKASTIRTHISSRMCINAPDHHAVPYNDFKRTERGTYRLQK